MLHQLFTEPTTLGIAQAVVTGALAIAVMLLNAWQGIHLERQTLIALARGLVQILIVGMVLTLLLGGPGWVSPLVLLGMTIAATSITGRRARGIPGAFTVALVSIGVGAGAVIVLMSLVGVIDVGINGLIPIGSMIIANAQITSAQAIERFRADVAARVGQLEAALALGAAPAVSVAPIVQAAVAASMIPRIDSLSSLGIVWIPGLMAGMVLAGGNPTYAALYQFVTVAMIYAASGLTALLSALLIRRRAFSAAEQLILRPAAEGK